MSQTTHDRMCNMKVIADGTLAKSELTSLLCENEEVSSTLYEADILESQP